MNDIFKMAEQAYHALSIAESELKRLYKENAELKNSLNRKWVGLTDEEIYDYADKFLYQHGSNYGIKSFGKAVEAKLKEKNT